MKKKKNRHDNRYTMFNQKIQKRLSALQEFIIFGKANRKPMFYINEDQIEASFRNIANTLLLEKGLQVNNALFRFTEIEFYYNCPEHKDEFTHAHEMETGRWRFHNQGFDITLKGETGYGGILIRGVNNSLKALGDEQKYVNGPRRVLFEIFKHLAPVETTKNKLGIVDTERLTTKVFETYREGLGETEHTHQLTGKSFKEIDYRFIVEPQRFDKKQFSGAEKIARRFNNAELAFAFLGYKLSH